MSLYFTTRRKVNYVGVSERKHVPIAGSRAPTDHRIITHHLAGNADGLAVGPDPFIMCKPSFSVKKPVRERIFPPGNGKSTTSFHQF